MDVDWQSNSRLSRLSLRSLLCLSEVVFHPGQPVRNQLWLTKPQDVELLHESLRFCRPLILSIKFNDLKICTVPLLKNLPMFLLSCLSWKVFLNLLSFYLPTAFHFNLLQLDSFLLLTYVASLYTLCSSCYPSGSGHFFSSTLTHIFPIFQSLGHVLFAPWSLFQRIDLTCTYLYCQAIRTSLFIFHAY